MLPLPRAILINHLKPLDVILTRVRFSPKSLAIAAFTKGPFSHATLVVSPCIRFEATSSGIGFSVARPDYVTRSAGHPSPLFVQSTHRWARIAIYRHPQIDGLSEKELRALQDSLVDIAADFNALRYPPPKVFAAMARHLNRPTFVCDRIAKFGTDKSNSGPFCSQLVADILAHLGYPAFAGSRDSTTITPSEFRSSCLKRIPIPIVPAPSRHVDDWSSLRELHRAVAPVEASLMHFEARREMFAHLVEFMDVFQGQARAGGTPSWQVNAGTQSIADATNNMRNHERNRVIECVQRERWLFGSQSSGPLAWCPSPTCVRRALIRAEPRPAALLHPIVEYLDSIGVDWNKLKAEIP